MMISKLECVSRYPGELELPPVEAFEPTVGMRNMIIVSEQKGGLDPIMAWFKESGFKLDHLQNLNLDEIESRTAIICDRATKDEDFFGRLAGLAEEPNRKLFILTHNINLLMGTGPFSTVYNRLPTYHAITELPGDLAQASKKLIVDYLGDQYTLTQRFQELNKVNSTEEKQVELLEDFIDRIELNPPNFIAHWIDQLNTLIKDPATKGELSSYLEGEVKPVEQNVTQSEIKLYLAGWLRIDAEDKLRIRSKIHQRIAKTSVGGIKWSK